MTVDEFVALEARRPFEWGLTDCASTADRWVQISCCFSPLGYFGRSYNNEDEAKEWLSETPLPIAVNRVMRLAGLRRTERPSPGDVGILVAGEQACVGILTSRFWFSRNEHGLIGSQSYWKAWSVS